MIVNDIPAKACQDFWKVLNILIRNPKTPTVGRESSCGTQKRQPMVGNLLMNSINTNKPFDLQNVLL